MSFYDGDECSLPPALQASFLRLVPTDRFPIHAEWFSGHLRIPTGPRLVSGFHGMAGSWFARERVITCRNGRVVRDRDVDTLAMLERALRRYPRLKQDLDPDNTPGGPLAWSNDDDGDYNHLRGDWWPSESPANPYSQARLVSVAR